MNQEDIQMLKIAVKGIYESVQSRDAMNLKTIKFLSQRMGFLEGAFAVALGEKGKALTKGQEEAAQEFNNAIAKIESHQEQLEAYFATVKGFLDVEQ